MNEESSQNNFNIRSESKKSMAEIIKVWRIYRKSKLIIHSVINYYLNNYL